MNGLTVKDAPTDATIEMPSIGLGAMRTSATYAAMFIELEGCRESRMDVLASVLDALGIFPEELIHLRAMPDVCNEAEYERWKQEAGSIRERCLSAEKLIAEARKRC